LQAIAENGFRSGENREIPGRLDVEGANIGQDATRPEMGDFQKEGVVRSLYGSKRTAGNPSPDQKSAEDRKHGDSAPKRSARRAEVRRPSGRKRFLIYRKGHRSIRWARAATLLDCSITSIGLLEDLL
jgi:hypothetical protein